VVSHVAVPQFTDKHGTCSAITFPASDLCSREVPAIPDKVEQDPARRLVSRDGFVIENKLYHGEVCFFLKLMQKRQ
jgi:hypothetical protein